MSDISSLPADDVAAAPEPGEQPSAALDAASLPAPPTADAADEAEAAMTVDAGAEAPAVDTQAAAAAAADPADPADAADPADPTHPAAPAGPATPPVADLSPAQCSAHLAAQFPALFGLQQPLPLKLRIQADIQLRAPGIFNRKSLSAFLHRYTTGTPYLQALARIPQRADLDGQPAGEVADEHRDAAVAEVARRRTLMDARRVAEQAARREADATQRTAQREAETAARQQRQSEQERDQQGRRERATLLRAFDTSTLTRANFCALKGIVEADLDAQLAQARQEAAERPPAFEERSAPRQHVQGKRGPAGGRPGGGGGGNRGERPAGGPGQRPRRPHPGA